MKGEINMSENKLCPKCGSKMFIASFVKGCVVEVSEENGINTYKILKESNNPPSFDIIKCARCKEEISEEDLVIGVACKKCGRVVNATDLNSDGVCNVCEAQEKRSELANASREDLIRMLLEAEKGTTTQAVKHAEKAIETAEEAVIPSVDTNIQETEEVPTETVTEEKPRRRRRKKKDDESTEESPEEEVVTENQQAEQTEAVTDIASQQEAPFPDVQGDIFDAMQLPVTEESPASNNQPFDMFSDDDEQF